MAVQITMIGPPGAGKGTQAKRLAAMFHIPHISTGDMLRVHVVANDHLGKHIADMVSKGELVPDNILLDMVRVRLVQPDCAKGFVLDGFPRTVFQAAWLHHLHYTPYAVLLEVSEETVLQRIAARNEGRPDDKSPDTVKNRLREYNEQTKPVVEFYDNLEMLRRVDGNQGMDEVFASALKELRGPCTCGAAICEKCGLCVESWGHLEDCAPPKAAGA
jgi:adenylate kinase